MCFFFVKWVEVRSSCSNNGLLLLWTRTMVLFYFEQEQRSSFTLNKNNGLLLLWTRTMVLFYFEQEQRPSFTLKKTIVLVQSKRRPLFLFKVKEDRCSCSKSKKTVVLVQSKRRPLFLLNKNNGLFFLWTRITVFFYFEQEQRSSFTNNYFSPQLI
jgi:hypothetical protein